MVMVVVLMGVFSFDLGYGHMLYYPQFLFRKQVFALHRYDQICLLLAPFGHPACALTDAFCSLFSPDKTGKNHARFAK